MSKWEVEYFYSRENSMETPSDKLKEFLNKEGIKEFKFIKINDTSIKIIYLED